MIIGGVKVGRKGKEKKEEITKISEI